MTDSQPNSITDDPAFQQLLDSLAADSSDLERADAWPLRQFQALADAGVLGWVIPQEYSGSACDGFDMLCGYERLSSACLTTAFILTQRNGACQRIAGSTNDDLKQRLLPRLAGGELFATVGISHLTTSRQHLDRPAVLVEESADGFVFNGLVPWVTGADQADIVVTGGTLSDGRQVLAAIPTGRRAIDAASLGTNSTDRQSSRVGSSASSSGSIHVRMPDPLLALNATRTASIELRDVLVPANIIIAGPIDRVMQQGSGGGTGSLTTSALAIGLATTAIAQIGTEAARRPDLADIHNQLDQDRRRLSADLRLAQQAGSTVVTGTSPCRDDNSPREARRAIDAGDLSLSSEAIRQRANSLALRSTQACLTVSKGAGFAKGHPAERMVREAMFFLVWSCPQPVAQAALRDFACASSGGTSFGNAF